MDKPSSYLLKALLSNIFIYFIDAVTGFIYTFTLFHYIEKDAASFYFVFLSYYYVLNLFTTGPISYTLAYYLPKHKKDVSESLAFYGGIIGTIIISIVTFIVYPLLPLNIYTSVEKLIIMNSSMFLFYFLMSSLFLLNYQLRRTLLAFLTLVGKIGILFISIKYGITDEDAIFYSLSIPYMLLSTINLFMFKKDFSSFISKIPYYTGKATAGIMLFFDNMAKGVTNIIDNFILPFVATPSEISAYNASFLPSRFLLRDIPSIISSSTLPLLRRDEFEHLWKKSLYYMAKFIIILLFPATTYFLLFSEEWMLFYSPKYVDHLWLMQTFLISLFFLPLMVVIINIILAAEKLKDVITIRAISALSNIILNIVLGLYFKMGYIGVAIATIVSLLLATLYTIIKYFSVMVQLHRTLLKMVPLLFIEGVVLFTTKPFIENIIPFEGFFKVASMLVYGGVISLLTSILAYYLNKEKFETKLENRLKEKLLNYIELLKL